MTVHATVIVTAAAPPPPRRRRPEVRAAVAKAAAVPLTGWRLECLLWRRSSEPIDADGEVALINKTYLELCNTPAIDLKEWGRVKKGAPLPKPSSLDVVDQLSGPRQAP